MKFSFCTTCMGRLEFLKQTIFVNINLIKYFNKFYENEHYFEYSLCNYDSKDYLEEFILENFSREIEENIFIYSRVYNKEYFNVNHAKNIAHRNSTGDILINLDADNFLTLGFIKYIIKLFENDIDIITLGQLFQKNNEYDVENNGGYGRICISRQNFYKLDGYNEIFENCGYGDDDLYKRALKYLNLKNIILNVIFLKVLSHSNEYRVANYKIKERMKAINNNAEISNWYLENNIIKPNEYNNIEFGKI